MFIISAGIGENNVDSDPMEEVIDVGIIVAKNVNESSVEPEQKSL